MSWDKNVTLYRISGEQLRQMFAGRAMTAEEVQKLVDKIADEV